MKETSPYSELYVVERHLHYRVHPLLVVVLTLDMPETVFTMVDFIIILAGMEGQIVLSLFTRLGCEVSPLRRAKE